MLVQKKDAWLFFRFSLQVLRNQDVQHGELLHPKVCSTLIDAMVVETIRPPHLHFQPQRAETPDKLGGPGCQVVGPRVVVTRQQAWNPSERLPRPVSDSDQRVRTTTCFSQSWDQPKHGCRFVFCFRP